jgi:hypothetical protein
MSNRLINIVQSLDAKKLKAAIKAQGLVCVNIKPLLWIVADKTNDERLGAGSWWSQKKMAKMLGCGKRNTKLMQDVAEAIGVVNVTPRKVEGGRDKPNILVLTRALLRYVDEELLEDIGETVAGITKWVQQLPPVDESVADSGCKDCGQVGATVAAETKYLKPNRNQEGEAEAPPCTSTLEDEIEDLPVTEPTLVQSAGPKSRPVRSQAEGSAASMCPHSYAEHQCPHCLAEKGCKICRGWGLRTVKAPTKRDPAHEVQVTCECTGNSTRTFSAQF